LGLFTPPLPHERSILTALGAILTLSLLAIDTFFQQLTELPVRWTLQKAASISRVIRYKPEYVPEFIIGDKAGLSDPYILAFATSFFVANGTEPVSFDNGTRTDIPLSCTISSFTWPAYETLGTCPLVSSRASTGPQVSIPTRLPIRTVLRADVSSKQLQPLQSYCPTT
jgi:hypothetical protein